MSKEFYTEKDIEDLVRRGVLSLEINDDVVLTGLAYEKAHRLGMNLIADKPGNPPGAPVRPYVLQKHPSSTITAIKPSGTTPPSPDGCACAAARPEGEKKLHDRIRTAVVARLGSQVDEGLLDVIIKRVLSGTGVK